MHCAVIIVTWSNVHICVQFLRVSGHVQYEAINGYLVIYVCTVQVPCGIKSSALSSYRGVSSHTDVNLIFTYAPLPHGPPIQE